MLRVWAIFTIAVCASCADSSDATSSVIPAREPDQAQTAARERWEIATRIWQSMQMDAHGRSQLIDERNLAWSLRIATASIEAGEAEPQRAYEDHLARLQEAYSTLEIFAAKGLQNPSDLEIVRYFIAEARQLLAQARRAP